MSNLLTGFPWLILGLSQYKNPFILKIARFTGIYGISFIIIGTNLFLYTILSKNFSYQNTLFFLFLLILLSISRIPQEKKFKGSLNILLIQPNFLPSQINLDENKDMIIKTLEKNLKGKKVDIVIFPEGSYKENIFENRELIEKLKVISNKNKCGIIIGTFIRENGNSYNSSVFINGKKVEIYRKIKLVPYGEFILGERFKFVRDIFLKIAGYKPDLKSGDEFKVFEFKNLRFSTIICYENVFSEFTEKFLKNGADFFVVITNDSWFGKSIGPYQHFYHNVLRSIETGRYFLQASLTGISGIINPDGEIEKIAEKLFTSDFLYQNLPIYTYETFYSKYGIFPFFLFSLILTGILLCKS